jgi:hypothetical protein
MRPVEVLAAHDPWTYGWCWRCEAYGPVSAAGEVTGPYGTAPLMMCAWCVVRVRGAYAGVRRALGEAPGGDRTWDLDRWARLVAGAAYGPGRPGAEAARAAHEQRVRAWLAGHLVPMEGAEVAHLLYRTDPRA